MIGGYVVQLHLRERRLFTEEVSQAFVGSPTNRTLVYERFIEAVEALTFLANNSLQVAPQPLSFALAVFQASRTIAFSGRMYPVSGCNRESNSTNRFSSTPLAVFTRPHFRQW